MKTPGRRSTQKLPPQTPYRLTEQKYLSETEYTELHRYLETQEASKPQYTALLFTAIYTGARASEVLNIRPEDLNAQDQTVKILGLKSSSDRIIPIPGWLFTQLSNLTKQSPGTYIFEIGYQRLHQIWVSYRRHKKKFHSLRHTFAVRLYKRTKDVHLVQKALGHRSLHNTLIYLHYVSSKEEMKRIIDPGALR